MSLVFSEYVGALVPPLLWRPLLSVLFVELFLGTDIRINPATCHKIIFALPALGLNIGMYLPKQSDRRCFVNV